MTSDLELVERAPLDADAWRRLAVRFIAEKKVTEALDALARAHHFCPPRSGQTLLEISKLLEMLADRPESVPQQLALARSCALLGFFDRAILHAEKALVHEIENVDAHRDLAEYFWRRGRHEESIDALNRVLWVRKDDITIALLLAERLLELNRDKSAMMIIRRIADRIPPTGDAELRVGRLLRRCGAPEQALWHLEKAVVLVTGSPHAHFELALAYIEAGRPAAATEDLLETARLRPDWGEPLRRLAAIYRDLGMTSEALRVEEQLQAQPITLDIDEIVEVKEEFADSSEISGRLRLMPVAELLQFLAQRTLTGVLRVTTEQGVGTIEIYRGSVVGAQLEGIHRLLGKADAEEQFLHCQTVIGEMIGWTDGQIDFVSGASYDGEPKVKFEVAHLLLEAIRRLDEANA